MAYQFEKDAEKFKKDILAKGGKAILTKEDAPANATGTAVAGTGDDSSTVVVKKKKELQKKLMTRMGIKEAIDKAIPDLEYPKDEIRERVNQLKELALGETPEGYAMVQKAKDIAKKMSGNMNGAIKEIEKLEKGLSNNSSVKDALKKANEELSEGERALARDKSTDQPKKYVSGLTDKQKKAHDRHLEKQGKKSDSDKSAYKQSPADKVAKTKPSKHTNKFKKMYGEDYLNEKIKGLETKAKKSGMPYSILKKVYDRGMAAWKGGHRPGTTPQQWAFARVNSFVTKSSGTWGKADKDLADKVRASEEVEVQETELGMIPKKKRKGHEVLGTGGAFGEKNIKEWFESNMTRASYQLRHGEDWWWKLNEVHDAMLEKIGACCDDCADGIHEETELKEKGPCWDGFKQVGMKMKGGKQVPNCVPESWTQEDIDENLRKVKGTDNLYEPKKMTKFARTKSMIDYLKTRDNKDAEKRKKDKSTSGYKMRMFNQMENIWGEITEKDDKSGKELNNPTRGDVKKYKVYVKNDKGNVVKVEFGDPNMSIKRDDPARRKSFRARHNCENPGPKWKARYWSCKFWSTKSVTDLMKG